jgi:hypothetical protein
MARWTDIATWVGPTVNEGDGDSTPGESADHMAGHVGLVVHIAEGTYDGTIAWEHNPVAEVSSHFVVAKDGRIAQVVDTDDRSWCQSQGNATWISVENEGFHTQAPTPQQVEALARIYARCMQVYAAPARVTDSVDVGGIGWHGMGGDAWGGHVDCPGDQFKAARPAILARALEIMNGDDMSAHTEAVIEAWRTGMTRAADGSPVEPVNWRIRDEQWQAAVNAKLDALAARPPAVFTADQVHALGDQLAAAVVAHHDALTDADAPVIAAAARDAVRSVLDGARIVALPGT